VSEPGFMRVLPCGTMQGVPVEAFVEAAAIAGFDAVSFSPRMVQAWLSESSGRTVADLRSLVDGAGLSVSELDPVAGWHDAPRSPSGVELPAETRRTMAWAAELGAARVTALVLPGEVHEVGPASEGLTALVELGAELGVAVQVEPFAWSSLHGLAEAAAMARAAGPAERVGLMVDTWHLVQAGGGPAAAAELEVERVHGVQLADGVVAKAGTDLAAENRTERRWPGEGSLHPEQVLADLAARGWRGPVGVEVFGPVGAASLPRARRARAALDLVLDQVSGATARPS